MRHLAPAVLLGLSISLYAEAGDDFTSPRLAAQLLVGTAGFEPGIAAEWRMRQYDLAFTARPEVFINDDGKIGGGASLGWQLEWDAIKKRHDLTIGPRIVYHNSDEYGWEASAMAIYSIPLTNMNPDRHFIQLIGAAGLLEDEEDESTVFGGTFGAAYAYQF